MSDHIRNISS